MRHVLRADTQAVLECLRSALTETTALAQLDDLVVLGTQRRRRSTIYFVGRAATPLWVVKQPKIETRQHDLEPPVPASLQFAALQELFEDLQAYPGVSTPRPTVDLPEVGAFAMEFVEGTSITALIRLRAMAHPGPLLRAVRFAASALRVLHSLDSVQESPVDIALSTSMARDSARFVLETAGLPRRREWFLPSGDRRQPSAPSPVRVRLHGDYAPENVLLTRDTVYCLEPDRTAWGPAELDVTRFLTMLFDAPVFVAHAGVRPVQRVRQQAAAAFVHGYYLDRPVPATLGPLLVQSLARRWVTRHENVLQRQPAMRAARTVILRRYFQEVLDEVSVADR